MEFSRPNGPGIHGFLKQPSHESKFYETNCFFEKRFSVAIVDVIFLI